MISKQLREPLSKLPKYLASTIATVIIGALLKGDELKGLAPAKALWAILATGVPLWALLFAVCVAIHFFTAWFRTRKQSSLLPQGQINTLPSGLASFQTSFHHFTDKTYFQDQDLLLVFNDARAWVEAHTEELKNRVLVRGQRVRVLLLHPQSNFLKVLDRKTEKLPNQEIMEIQYSFKILSELQRLRPNLVEVKGHYLFNPYTLILTTTEAIVMPYFLMKRGELPVLVFKNFGQESIYHQYRSDAESLWAMSVHLTDQDFPITPLSLAAQP